MALLFSDGFDNYTSSANLTSVGYSVDTNSATVTFDATGSRWSTPSLRIQRGAISGSAAIYSYPFTVTDNSLRVAFWYKTAVAVSLQLNSIALRLTNGNLSPTRFVVFRLASNASVSISGLNSSSSASALLTGSTIVNDGQWHHIEFYLMASQTSGSMELWIDGVSQGTFSGVTSNVSDTVTVLTNAFFTQADSTSVANNFDDLVIWDDAGTDFTGYMGPHRTRVLRPNGAGSTTNFTSAAGANWENIDEQVFSSIDYNEASSAADKDLYAYPDMSPLPATIKGVALRSVVHNPDVGTKTFRLLCKSGATTANGATFTATSAPKVYMTPFGKDPNTSAAWGSAINSAEFGIEVVS